MKIRMLQAFKFTTARTGSARIVLCAGGTGNIPGVGNRQRQCPRTFGSEEQLCMRDPPDADRITQLFLYLFLTYNF